MLANDSRAKKHYRIPAENANSVCLQTARTPKNIIESLPKCETHQPQKLKFFIDMTPKDHQKGHGDTKAGFSLLLNTNFKGKAT